MQLTYISRITRRWRDIAVRVCREGTLATASSRSQTHSGSQPHCWWCNVQPRGVTSPPLPCICIQW